MTNRCRCIGGVFWEVLERSDRHDTCRLTHRSFVFLENLILFALLLWEWKYRHISSYVLSGRETVLVLV